MLDFYLNQVKTTRRFMLSLFFISICCSSVALNSTSNASSYFVTLTLKTFSGGLEKDCALYIQQCLAEVGIKVEIRVEEWIEFVGTLLVTHDFDLAIVSFGKSALGLNVHTVFEQNDLHVINAKDPDPTAIYTVDASLNIFGLNRDIPYVDDSEKMIREGVTITDLKKRQQHYYAWQQLMMDKIVPMLPLFTQRSYVAIWSNLKGYDNRWGIVDSLPYMYYEGEHEGQTCTKEFLDYNANWRELNPLLQDDASSSYISSLIMEPIMQMSPGGQPLTTGLIDSWEMINDSFFKFHMREGVYWNPSYNVTERTPDSDPLDPATTPLMIGLKGEVSNGTNQPVTAKDAVFTYLAWANPITSEDPDLYDWIKAIWVDPNDEYSFYIVVDGDPDTPELDPYAPFWVSLPVRILPEFFLNSTDTTVTYSAGGVKTVGIYDGILDTPAWKTFSVSAFGCGKYMLDYYIKNSVTVLQKSPYWEQNFGIGAIDGTPQDLDIDTIIIRVIPDETSALAEFKAGKLDIMGLTDFPSERKQMQNDPRFEIYASLKDIVTVLTFNLRRPYIGGDNNYWFLEKPGKEEYTTAAAIRKGICYAVDRNKINDDLYNGERIITDSPIAPSQTYWYYQNITKYEYNLTKASYWINLAGKPIVPPPPDANAMSIQWYLGVLVFCLGTYKLLKKIKKWHS